MLIKIKFECRGEDLEPKVSKFSPEDRAWFIEKASEADNEHPLKMNLAEVVRMLTAFDNVERIYFEVI